MNSHHTGEGFEKERRVLHLFRLHGKYVTLGLSFALTSHARLSRPFQIGSLYSESADVIWFLFGIELSRLDIRYF